MVMGNYSEFRRAAKLVLENTDFDKDLNVSVFETNIRGSQEILFLFFHRLQGSTLIHVRVLY